MRTFSFQKTGDIDAKWVVTLRERLSVTQERLARLLDVTSRTVARWEKDEAKPEPFLELKLKRVGLVTDKLGKSGGPEQIAAWLEKPDPSLKGYPPIDLMGSGYGPG